MTAAHSAPRWRLRPASQSLFRPVVRSGHVGARGAPTPNPCSVSHFRVFEAPKTGLGPFRHKHMQGRGYWAPLLYSLFSDYLSIYKDLRARLLVRARKQAQRALGPRNAPRRHGIGVGYASTRPAPTPVRTAEALAARTVPKLSLSTGGLGVVAASRHGRARRRA